MNVANLIPVEANSMILAKSNTELAQDQQYLTFQLNGEMYAFAILHVKEILEYGKVTQVPMMPDYIQGIINLRGEVVPVVNLARRFYLKPQEVNKKTCVVIIEVTNEEQRQDLGVMVDSVSEVIEISSKFMRPAPNFGTKIRAEFICGMAQFDEEFVIILAEDKVLSVEELAMMEQVKEQNELAS
ncbi:purine-binding chemotaxis protein CheW [Vibrio anguillarum]|nr:purine-binding chemotaxis protein CheW [Vibrio anguillarum]MBF4276596.1 purine-binding chemotaxis protein CheW [Vibrio anguillarum]MBF4299521.1 purine-binding chemotaxis protein CheW [Vibrio anguillarum]MBF4362153.1 purine-binding chemotaxis protein CheW [Vibrio anguillarum]MBF4398905.1 purine-binding chemotaxis protein CheW [Vibrio anguillarum]